MNKKIFLPSLLILLLVAGGWFALQNITFTYSISSRGIIYPSQEWTLTVNSDGTIVHKLEDHLLQSTSQLHTTEFQRGDAGSFRMHKDFSPSSGIATGDTIALIESFADLRKLQELRGDLAIQQQLLLLYASGERPQEIEIAHNRMILARQDMETTERIHQRNAQLYQQGHIAEEKYEISANEHQQKLQQYLIARAQYQAATSGAKEEQLEFVRANIRALQQNIDFLEQVRQSYTILSPIDGIVLRKYGAQNGFEGLFKIADLSTFVVRIPIDVYQIPYIELGQTVQIISPVHKTPIQARVIDIENSVQRIGQRQQIFVNALLEDTSSEQALLPGLLVEAVFRNEKLTWRQMLQRFIKEVYNN